MKRKSILKNNKGGGLILVIGCVALLSMIGAMLLVVTTNNRKMKDLERQMQQSFYGAESGSDELVSQLEIEAEEALKKAFADLMVQYSNLDTTDARNSRFAEFFQTAFYDEVTKSDAARKLMCEALGGDPTTDDLDALEVQVAFGSVENVPYVTGAGEDSTQICIRNATFTYSAGGSQTSITTDIIVDAKIPDVEGNMVNTIACDFTDFAVISGADVVTPLNTSQTIELEGNFYTKNSLLHRSENMVMNVNKAKKFLIAGDLVITNDAILNINTESNASGDGVWANNIEVSDGGELYANSNFYVSDDLIIEKSGAKIDIDGGEYIGYSGYNSGGTVDPSALSSAITINSAKDISLDFSGTTNLVLNGRSYIHDTLWSAGGVANALGILQGESVAYKDMQSIYLVPSECLVTNHNPMTLTEFNALTGCLMTDARISYKDNYNNEAYFDFREYLGRSTVPGDPDYALIEDNYVVRHVKLDGGTTEFVYLYLNFPTEKDAQDYFAAYMAVPQLEAPMKLRLDTLGNSTVKLAQNNYTLANAFQYDGTVTESTYGIQNATTNFSKLASDSLLAKRRTSGLFSSFRLNATSTENRNYDVITERILKMDKFDASNPTCPTPNTWIKNTYTTSSGTYDFWVYNGNVTIDNTVPANSGIILVNGKLTFSGTSKTFNGLVLATGGIEFNSETTIKSDKAAVEALLAVSEVQEYFRATGGSSTPASPYLSSEAVSISFDNWQKN